MRHRMGCRLSIPTFALTLSLILPAVGADARGHEPAERCRVTVLEMLWQWLGFADDVSVPVSSPNTAGSGPPGSGGEGQGTNDPTGTGTPPPEYDPDLNPGGG